MRIAIIKWLVAGALVASGVTGAGGQSDGESPPAPAVGGSVNNFASAFSDGKLQERLQRRMLERMREKQAARAGGSATPGAHPGALADGSAAQATPKEGKLPLTATDFPAAATRVVPASMAERMAHGSSARQTQLVAMFNQILDTIEPQTRRNNVAAAMAFAMAASEQVMADRAVLNPDRYGELVVQINDDLGDSAEFKALPDRRKQEIYESSLLTAGLIVGAYRQATQRGDSTLERQAKTAAAEYLREMNGAAQ